MSFKPMQELAKKYNSECKSVLYGKPIFENLKGGAKIIVCGGKGEISKDSMRKIEEFAKRKKEEMNADNKG